MAEVYRPTYSAIDPVTGKRVKRKSKTWHARYYLPDGKRVRVKGYRDKKATETMAAGLERRAVREAAGVIEPTDVHAKRPLTEHAADFRRYLTAKGNTADYVGLVIFRLTAVLDGCRFVRMADVQASAVVEFLARLRHEGGKGVKTSNEYLATAKGFTRWLWRDKRAGVDALAGLSKLTNGETDVRHARRDLSPDELCRLLETARASQRVKYKLTGTDRQFLYLTACATGFRVSELASLTPERFDLHGDTPTATVQAACTKNRKEAVQPLPRDVAAALAGYLRGKPAGEPVWPAGCWPVHASILIRRDLADARAAWVSAAQDAPERERRESSDFLTYCDASGRYADFHGLRHTFITMVGKAGVSPKEHQDLARHSTYALTGRYTHARFYDLSAAVQTLPISMTGPTPTAGELPATGTDGRADPSKNLGLNLGPQRANSGDFLRLAETADGPMPPTKNPGKQAVFAAFQGSEGADRKERDTGVEPVSQPWEGWAQPIYQSRNTSK
jgi:integrase